MPRRSFYNIDVFIVLDSSSKLVYLGAYLFCLASPCECVCVFFCVCVFHIVSSSSSSSSSFLFSSCLVLGIFSQCKQVMFLSQIGCLRY